MTILSYVVLFLLFILAICVFVFVFQLFEWIKKKREEIKKSRIEKDAQLIAESFLNAHSMFRRYEADDSNETFLHEIENYLLHGANMSELLGTEDPTSVFTPKTYMETVEMIFEEAVPKEFREDGVPIGEIEFKFSTELSSDAQTALGNLDSWITLPYSARKKHCYIIGASGSGKSTLIQRMIIAGMKLGEGIVVLSPEVELVRDKLLPFIPAERERDVVLLNPADSQCKYSINPFFVNDSEDIDLKCEDVFEIVNRLIDVTGMEQTSTILRYVIRTLVEAPNTSFEDIEPLLDRNSDSYRQLLCKQIKDERTKNFWNNTFYTFKRGSEAAIISRVDKFLSTNPKVRRILCSNENVIDFRQLMDEEKIVLLPISDGLIGETSAQLLGQLLVSSYQLAAMSRANIPEHLRVESYLYIDEFEEYIGNSSQGEKVFMKIISRARKFKAPITIAHQNYAQISNTLYQTLVGNTEIQIFMKVSGIDAGKIVTSRGAFDKNFSDKFRTGDALVKIGNRRAIIKTLPPLGSEHADYEIIKRITANSRTGSASETKIRTENFNDANDRTESDPFADLDPDNIGG